MPYTPVGRWLFEIEGTEGGGISTVNNVFPLRARGLSHRNKHFAPFLPIEAKEIGTVTKSDGLVAV